MKSFLTKSETMFLTKNQLLDDIQHESYQAHKDRNIQKFQGHDKLNLALIPKLRAMERGKSILQNIPHMGAHVFAPQLKSNETVEFFMSGQISPVSVLNMHKQQKFGGQSQRVLLLSTYNNKGIENGRVSNSELLRGISRSMGSSEASIELQSGQLVSKMPREMLVADSQIPLSISMKNYGEKEIQRPKSSIVVKKSNDKFWLEGRQTAQLGKITGKQVK